MQLLSKHAYQNIIYHCKNSIGYFDSERKTYRKGMKFLTWNDVELTPRGNQRLRYEMITDECRVSFALFKWWFVNLAKYLTLKHYNIYNNIFTDI